MSKISVLDIDYEFGGMKDTIHPVILADNAECVLVDCAYTGFLPQLEAAVTRAGYRCADITKVVITHHDHDHMGCLGELKRKYPHIQIIASEAEAPYISGQMKSMRLKQAEALQDSLPEDQKEFGLKFCEILRSVESVPADIRVKDGDTFDWCGGCEIVATPGHTPGHIALYLKNENTIITGDAAVPEDGSFAIANPQFTLDMQAAKHSLDKILSFPAETYICFHGGVLKKR